MGLLAVQPLAADLPTTAAMPSAFSGEEAYRHVAYLADRVGSRTAGSDKEGEAATEQEIVDWCRERIAVFKAPRRVEFRDSLPKLPTGKVLRRALRDQVHAAPTGDG